MRIGTMGAALASATLALANVAGGQGNEQGRSTHGGHGGHGGHGAHGSSAPASELPAAARAEIERVRAAVARYRDLDAARADGFVRFLPPPA